jgi:hypothetical protein
MASTKSGLLIQAIQTLKDNQKIEALKKDILQAIGPYTHDNMLRLVLHYYSGYKGINVIFIPTDKHQGNS